MTFEKLLKELDNRTFEEIATEYIEDVYGETLMVECYQNRVYEDDNLYEFLERIGAEVVSYYSKDGYVTIRSNSGRYYKVPYFEELNRFDDTLVETVLLFDEYSF